jgi:GT2 family glycosyltransferase
LKYIEQTLPKILALLNSNTELIIVDNGSADGTVEYIKNVIKSNPEKKITLIENGENLGISIAKNKGAKIAQGKYLLLLDDDMLIENPKLLDNLVEYYESLENPAFLMPLFLDKEELKDGRTRSYGTYYYAFGVKKIQPRKSIKDIMKYEKPIEIAINQGGAMFIKKDIWDELGGFDESQKFNLDDDDISTRALVYGYKNYLYNKEYIVHLGLAKRLDKDRYAWNDRTYYSGKAKSITKNFSWYNLPWVWFMASGRMGAEALWHVAMKMYPKIGFANLYSVFVYFRDLPGTFKKRRIIQKNRKRSDKYILKLRAPDYESGMRY